MAYSYYEFTHKEILKLTVRKHQSRNSRKLTAQIISGQQIWFLMWIL